MRGATDAEEFTNTLVAQGKNEGDGVAMTDNPDEPVPPTANPETTPAPTESQDFFWYVELIPKDKIQGKHQTHQI